MPDDHAPPLVPPDQTAAIASLLRRSDKTIESIVIGNSMTPAIPDGARIRIDCGSTKNLTVGSVVAYLGDHQPIIGHRIVGAGRGRHVRDMLVTRGDGSALCDAPIRRDQLLGEVTSWLCEGHWCSIPGRQRVHKRRQIVGAVSKFTVLQALEVHSGLSRWLARTSFRLARLYHRWSGN